MQDVKFSGLYIELDCLFDTRLATLFTLGVDTFKDVFDSSYYNRLEDVFKGISRQEFRKLYDARTKEFLKGPEQTPFVNFVKEFVKNTYLQTESTPHEMIPKIYVNIHPYKLNEKEQVVLFNSLNIILGENAPIEIIDLDISQVTPQFFKRFISVAIMYDYDRWLEHYAENGTFKHVSCPDVTLIGPMIYRNGLPTQAQVIEAQKAKLTPFQAMEFMAAPFVHLTLFPIENFSLARKIKKA